VLLTVKFNQKTLYRQIGCQFQGKRPIPFTARPPQRQLDRSSGVRLPAHHRDEHAEARRLPLDSPDLREVTLDIKGLQALGGVANRASST